MSKFFIDLCGPFVALIIGLIFFKKLDFPFRLLFAQIVIAIAIEFIGYEIKKQLPGKHNAWLYNLYIPIDCGLLIWAAYAFIKEKVKIKSGYFVLSYLGFICIWLYGLIQSGINAFAFIAVSIDGIVVLTAYLFVLYYSIISNAQKLIKLPVFWACIGLILYYGCSIPFFATHRYLETVLTNAENQKLFYILFILNYIRYFLTALAFFLHYKQSKTGKFLLTNASR